MENSKIKILEKFERRTNDNPEDPRAVEYYNGTVNHKSHKPFTPLNQIQRDQRDQVKTKLSKAVDDFPGQKSKYL